MIADVSPKPPSSPPIAFPHIPCVLLVHSYLIRVQLLSRPFLVRNSVEILIYKPKEKCFQQLVRLDAQAVQRLQHPFVEFVEGTGVKSCRHCRVFDVEVGLFY